MTLERFEDLSAWQEARRLVSLVYRITAMRSLKEDRDLARQMRRAATSIMSNIAEGFSRYSIKDSKQFYMVSRSSLSELRSQMYVAIDQQYLAEKDVEIFHRQMEIVGKLLSGLIRNARRCLEMSISKTFDGTIEPMNH